MAQAVIFSSLEPGTGLSCALSGYLQLTLYTLENHELYGLVVGADSKSIGLFHSVRKDYLNIFEDTFKKGFQLLPSGRRSNIEILVSGEVDENLLNQFRMVFSSYYSQFSSDRGTVDLGIKLQEGEKIPVSKTDISTFLKYVIEIEKRSRDQKTSAKTQVL